MTTTHCRVRVKQLVDNIHLDDDDASIVGAYCFTITHPLDADIEALDELARDHFHGKIGISCLDYFDIDFSLSNKADTESPFIELDDISVSNDDIDRVLNRAMENGRTSLPTM